MSTIDPPVQLANGANQPSVDYILQVASKPDFSFTPVNITDICLQTMNLYNYRVHFYMIRHDISFLNPYLVNDSYEVILGGLLIDGA